MIIAKNIKKSYGNNQVLKGIDITIKPGEICVITGASGAGKTTLLRSLALLDEPESGEISIDEFVYKFPNRKNHIAKPYPLLTIVFQQLFLWPHLTNKQNILLAANKKDIKLKEKLDHLIDHFEMKEFIDRYPNESSLGQKQRIALARAIILEPKYILLDEVTASLDMVQASKILKLLKEMAQKQIGIFYITHQINLAEAIADRIVFMKDGMITEEGGKDLFNNPQTSELKHFLNNIVIN